MGFIGNDWEEILKDFLASDDWHAMQDALRKEYSQYTCYPPKQKMFSAFKESSFADTKVVIIGQDPYHNPNEADGKCFSTSNDRQPPSLVNILQAVENDYPGSSKEGNLSRWAEQGVLLLNTSLSVRKNQPLSHANIGWDKLISIVINAVNAKGGIVFLLWGSHARNVVPREIRKPDNLYLETVHPSPLSAYRGFMNCGHFKKANEYLLSIGKTPINW